MTIQAASQCDVQAIKDLCQQASLLLDGAHMLLFPNDRDTLVILSHGASMYLPANAAARVGLALCAQHAKTICKTQTRWPNF